jgi:hypothetical protein
MTVKRSFWCGLLLVAMANLALGQECPRLLGRWGYGPAYAVAVSGSYAYVGAGSLLLVVNVANPAAPAVAGRVLLPGVVRGVAVASGRAYVAAGAGGMQVVSVLTPSNPSVIGSLDVGGPAAGIALSGTRAYIAAGAAGLAVVNIANPSAPALLGGADGIGEAAGVAVSGSFAYVASGYDGLLVIDVSNPATPQYVGGFASFEPARGVAVSGGYAFVAEDTFGVRVLDVSTPADPVEVASVDTAGNANAIALAGDYAYVADWAGGLQVLEVSDPLFPADSGFFETASAAWAVAVSGTRAFVAAETELYAVDVVDATAITELGALPLWSSAAGVAVAGTRMYVADSFAGLRVIEIGFPANPVQVGALATAGEALDVAVAGATAYVASGAVGLAVVDVGNPAGPVALGTLDTPGYARGVAVAGTWAYVADSFAGLRVVDVSNPASPAAVGAWDSPGSALGVAVFGGRAYLADGSGGLRVVDVTNPAAPAQVGALDTPGTAWGVSVSDGRAYVADWDGGVRIIDVSVPSAPVELGTVAITGNAVAAAAAGGRLFVADEAGVLHVFDIADPAAPVPIATHLRPGGPRDVVVGGTQVALAEGDAGASIWDLVQCSQQCEVACSASASRDGGEAPLEVVFVAEGSASGCGEGVSYEWDFGDGSPASTDASVTHVYANVGTWHWRVTVTAGGKTCTREGDVAVVPPCVLTCSAVVPATGLAGAVTAFAGTAAASDCSTPPAYAWTFGDGGPGSVLEDPTHVFVNAGSYPWTMTVTAGTRTCVATGTIAIGGPACSGGYALIVPAAAKSNGQWQTDLDLLNRLETAASVDVVLLKAGQSNLSPLAYNVAVPAGQTNRITDVLGTILPASNAALGVRFCTGEVSATSRFYNTSPKNGGTYGMYVPALPESAALPTGKLGTFQHLTYSPSSTSGYRVNIGFANAVGVTVDVIIKLYGDAGELLGTRAQRLRPFEHTQITKIHQILGTPAVSHGWATVEVLTANAKVHAYAMLIDNISSDPIYMPVMVE